MNNEGITVEDYAHVQKVWDIFEIINLGEYHDLYVQSDTLLLADVFENFRDKCIDICELDPSHFLPAPGLAWKACLKKTEVELELLTDNDMLLMVEGGIIRDRISQAVYRYAKDNNAYMNNYDKSIDSSYLMYLNANNLYGWTMSQELPVNRFKCLDDLSKLNESLMKNYNENNDEGYILEVDVEYTRQLFNLHKYFPFLPKREKN